jgi:hypothetical protein
MTAEDGQQMFAYASAVIDRRYNLNLRTKNSWFRLHPK